jgi:hypothetical protein
VLERHSVESSIVQDERTTAKEPDLLHRRQRSETIRCIFATACAAALLVTAPASARDTLGVFNSWGAFRDATPERCYAIAQPDHIEGAGSGWHAFASVATWPALGKRNQLHLRLSRRYGGRTAPVLLVGEERFPLIAGGADAWAPDARTDAMIVATMRSERAMMVVADGVGGPIRDAYLLKGAATAIDAAQLGCAKLR